MARLRDDRHRRFSRTLLRWYSRHRRVLPWRGARDPYRIFVSEVMLQQTQVERVKVVYRRWLRAFPTVRVLAAASSREVILAWRGMGYNRRALYLRDAARMIRDGYGGRFPRTREELQRLPGVGPATAGSLLSFAFGQDTPSLDVNVRRVLRRYFVGSEHSTPAPNERQIRRRGEWAISPGRGGEWNEAMMDFGSLQCTARRPACETCPLRYGCRAYPTILTDIAHTRRAAATKRKRGTVSALPDRIYRGRLVDLLRTTPGHALSLSALGPRLRDDYTAARAAWLRRLIQGLIRDGLVRRRSHGRQEAVALP